MNHYQGNTDDNIVGAIILITLIAVMFLYSRKWKPARTAFGFAAWVTDKTLRALGMLGNNGLILGRTVAGEIIRIPRYFAVLLIGGAGSGKGVSILIPNIFRFRGGSLIVHDTKGDLYDTTAEHRRRNGDRIIRLAPFSEGSESWNLLDTIPADSSMLVDWARAMVESLVARAGTESDPYWNEKAVQILTAILVLVLLRFAKADRNLNTVQDIASDPKGLWLAGGRLQEMGGLPARMGNQIKALFDKEQMLTKEGSGVVSNITRHLSFLDSDMVARSVATSTFDVECLLSPGVTLYVGVPPGQLKAQKNWLRCVFSTLIRVIGAYGSENNSEVMFMIDEASALGSLPAIEEALVRGRSAGCRILLAYQSDSQVAAAFKDKPTLISDNCSVQIHLGANSYEGAEKISKKLGEFTQVVDSYNENSSSSQNTGGQSGGSVSRGSSMNYAQQGRALLRPEEVLTLNENYLIAFVQGLPGPILARRIKWYSDPTFSSTPPKAKRSNAKALLLLVAALLGLLLYAYMTAQR